MFPFDPSKLPEVFRRLPADRYRLYLIEDGMERLILEFTIEQGQPIEIPEVNEVEPGAGDAGNLPTEDAAGIEDFDGSRFAEGDQIAPQLASPAIEGDIASHGAIQFSRHESQLTESFAERLGKSSFVSHGGVVVCAAAVAYASNDHWEKSIDRLMERFDRRRLPKWRIQSDTESQTGGTTKRNSIHATV